MPGLSPVRMHDSLMSSAQENMQTTVTLAWATVLGESVSDICWSVDNGNLYAGSVSGELIASDENGESLFITHTHSAAITSIKSQPQGNLIATSGEDGKVHLSDASNGDLVETVIDDQQWAEVINWSPDGSLLAGAVGKKVFVLDEKHQVETWDGHPGIVGALDWAPNGKRLASCTNKGVYLWNVGSWEPVKVLDFPGAGITLAWNADGRALAAGTQDGFMHLRLQMPGTTPRQLSMSGYPGKVACLDWNPSIKGNQYCIATCGGNEVVLWYLQTKSGNRKAIPLRRHERAITKLAWSADGTLLVSADRSGRICFWSANGDFEFDMELGSEVTALAWHPKDFKLAIGHIDGSLRLFSFESGTRKTRGSDSTN